MPTPDRDRRTNWISAVGIVAVIIAGAFAVGANLGILSASSDNEVGALAATGDLVTAPAAVATTDASAAATDPRTFVVDAAGSVTIDNGAPLTIETVAVNPGWEWHTTPSSPSELDITFSSATRTLVFHAVRAKAGELTASVEEPGAIAPAAWSDDDHVDDDHDDDDHDDHDDDGHDDEEHEGHDDDD